MFTRYVVALFIDLGEGSTGEIFLSLLKACFIGRNLLVALLFKHPPAEVGLLTGQLQELCWFYGALEKS
jgi:hypothetical protein